MTTRTITEIAIDIQLNWQNVYYGARPYLDAMFALRTIDDYYASNSARSVINYFLANSQTWRGETAKRIKDELKQMIK